MSKFLCAFTALTSICIATNSFAGNVHDHKDHAHKHTHNHKEYAPTQPASIMGGHFHDEGSLMLSYNFKTMNMRGLLDGSDSITPSQAVSATGPYKYMMTPTKMSMNMHMIGAMYGVSDDVTLMAMGQYMENRMDMLSRMGVQSKMKSEGFGDTSISALYKISDSLFDKENSTLYAKLGLSLPTGSSGEQGVRMGTYGNLPYSMQLGSGTYDPILAIGYNSSYSSFDFGTQLESKIRTAKNNQGYRLGDEYTLNSWVSKPLTDFASASIRLEGISKGSMNGYDKTIHGMRNMAPTFDAANSGGEQVNLGFGVNLYQNSSSSLNHKLSLEYTLPVYQDLNGVQMKNQNSIMLGYSLSF